MVSSRLFERFILTCLLLNIAAMACRHFAQSDDFSYALDLVSKLFTVLFMVEALLLIVAMGPKEFWANDWNKLDLIVICLSMPDLFIVPYAVDTYRPLFSIQTLLISRVLRIIKLLKVSSSSSRMFCSLFVFLLLLSGIL
jgi:voltage-gated sodium channel